MDYDYSSKPTTSSTATAVLIEPYLGPLVPPPLSGCLITATASTISDVGKPLPPRHSDAGIDHVSLLTCISLVCAMLAFIIPWLVSDYLGNAVDWLNLVLALAGIALSVWCIVRHREALNPQRVIIVGSASLLINLVLILFVCQRAGIFGLFTRL